MHLLRRLTAPVLLAALLPAQEAVAWHQDFDAARRQAQEQQKPLLLLFRCER